MSNQFPPPQQGPQGGQYPGPHTDPYANPQAGLPTYTGPQEPGYGFAPHPQTMPGVVRAAQIVLWVLAGIGVVGIVAAGALGGAELAGAVTFAYICVFVSAGFAFRFGDAGNGVRVTCIVLMSVEMLITIGNVSRGGSGGLLGLGAAIAVVVLLSQGAAAAWFKRPRTPYGH